MPKFDQDVLIRLVGELRKSVQRLSALSQIDEDRFLEDPDKIASAKYHFIVAIEACIDLCNHIVSRNGLRVPEDYGDTFRVMAEAGALSPEFSEELVGMGKFRNRLVHLYWEVNAPAISKQNLRPPKSRKYLKSAKFKGLMTLPMGLIGARGKSAGKRGLL